MKANKLAAPASAEQAQTRFLYATAKPALAVVNMLDAKGVALGPAALLATVDSKAVAGLGGATLGTALGGAGGVAVGSGLGLAATDAVRGIGRRIMSTDEQSMFNAVQNAAALVYRKESGGAVTAEEQRMTIERFFPLKSDKPAVRALKRDMRAELNAVAAQLGGVSDDIAKPILDKLLADAEGKLNKADPDYFVKTAKAAERAAPPPQTNGDQLFRMFGVQ